MALRGSSAQSPPPKRAKATDEVAVRTAGAAERILPSAAAAGPPSEMAQQLEALGDATASLVARTARTSREGLVLKVDTHGLTVGSLSSGTSRPLLCFGNRLEYKFLHPDHKTVDMVMYYADTSDARVDERNAALRFHIDTPLDLFASHYDSSDRTQELTVKLRNRKDVDEVVARVLPLMRGKVR